MNHLDPAEVLALLEEGPKSTQELANLMSWLACRGLKQMARDGLIASHSPRGTAWRARIWALPSATRVLAAPALPPSVARPVPKVHGRHTIRVEDQDFEVVWSGRGPLPSAHGNVDGPGGLGSSLAGLSRIVR